MADSDEGMDFPKVPDFVDSKRDVAWVENTHDASCGTRFGGEPFAGETYELLKNWPHFQGKPLPFFAQVNLDGSTMAYAFLNDNVDGSWQPEDGANAVLVSGHWVAGPWIELKPVSRFKKYSRKSYTPLSTLREPDWLQGDETPDGYRFVLQVPSQLDDEKKVNIGNGYGDAYIFVSDDGTTGKILWQS